MQTVPARVVRPTGCVATSVGAETILSIIEWLTSDDCHEADDAGLAAGLGTRLREAGLPVDRLTLHLRTLHPAILGRSIAWAPNEPVEVRDREHGIETVAAFAGNPVRQVMQTRQPLVIRLGASNDPAWIHADFFEGRGLVEFVVVPLSNADCAVSAASFSTARATGFTASERAALERIVPALRTACEIRTLRRNELTLLNTYLGADAGRQVLNGSIKRGDGETIHTVIWFSDLRRSTALAESMPPDAFLALLNDYFECTAGAVLEHGGEVLRFIGDASLAIFPVRDGRTTANDAARRALAAAAEAERRLAALNRRRRAAGTAEIDFGIGLHRGDVLFGNIGVAERLEFSVIGPAANEAARLEGLTKVLGRRVLVSGAFAETVGAAWEDLGAQPIAGARDPIAVFAPKRDQAPGADESAVSSAKISSRSMRSS
jgi:adenylate cyclase